MSTKFENAGHSYTEAGYFKEEEKNLFQKIFKPFEISEALAELIAMHKREMTDETITLKEWQTAVKKGEKALENFNQKLEE